MARTKMRKKKPSPPKSPDRKAFIKTANIGQYCRAYLEITRQDVTPANIQQAKRDFIDCEAMAMADNYPASKRPALLPGFRKIIDKEGLGVAVVDSILSSTRKNINKINDMVSDNAQPLIDYIYAEGLLSAQQRFEKFIGMVNSGQSPQVTLGKSVYERKVENRSIEECAHEILYISGFKDKDPEYPKYKAILERYFEAYEEMGKQEAQETLVKFRMIDKYLDEKLSDLNVTHCTKDNLSVPPDEQAAPLRRHVYNAGYEDARSRIEAIDKAARSGKFEFAPAKQSFWILALENMTGTIRATKAAAKEERAAARHSKASPSQRTHNGVQAGTTIFDPQRNYLDALQSGITAQRTQLRKLLNTAGGMNTEYQQSREVRKALGQRKDETPELNKPRISDLFEKVPAEPQPAPASEDLSIQIAAATLKAKWLKARINAQELANERLEQPLAAFRNNRVVQEHKAGASQPAPLR